VSYYLKHWFSNIRSNALAGLVVALALIPEAIAFSIIAGVDPKVGLYASFSMSVVIAFTGGRPGMISAATGAMALVMVTLVKTHGVEYLFAATVLTGILQVLAGFLQLGSVLRFVSRSVVTGFVNALAILIFMAQLPEFYGAGLTVYAMVAGGLGIIYLFPYVTKSIPSPLVCIFVLTLICLWIDLDIRVVGDMGKLPSSLPVFFFPEIPLTFETFKMIFPYSVTLAAVGLLESLMTAVIVDDLTDTPSDKNRECWGQGVANMMTGVLGGMAGCAMIGQSVINVKSGGRGRMSTLLAGVFLLFLIIVLGKWVEKIPMAALVSVMIMVSVGTFNWESLKNLKTMPKSSSLVMMTTVAVVVFTHNLAIGVVIGVLMSALFFARKVSQLFSVQSESTENRRIYKVYGQVFFVSANDFVNSFDFKDVIENVTIDLTQAHFWDFSAVGALDKVILKLRREGTKVEILGLNKASTTLVEKLAVHDKPGVIEINH